MRKKEKRKDDVFRFRCEEEWLKRLTKCAKWVGRKSASAWVFETMTALMELVESAHRAGVDGVHGGAKGPPGGE